MDIRTHKAFTDEFAHRFRKSGYEVCAAGTLGEQPAVLVRNTSFDVKFCVVPHPLREGAADTTNDIDGFRAEAA